MMLGQHKKFWYRLIAEPDAWHAARRLYSGANKRKPIVIPEADDPSFDPSMMKPGDWLISEGGAWHPVTAIAEVRLAFSQP